MNGDRPAFRRMKLDGHPTLADEIEMVGFLSLLENQLAGVEADVGGTTDQELKITWLHVYTKRVTG